MRIDLSTDLKWPAFFGRMLLGALWIASSDAAILIGTADGAHAMTAVRYLCAAIIAAPPVLWALSLQWRLGRADEMERKIIAEGTGHGAAFALTWGALMAAFSLIAPGYHPSTLPALLADMPGIAMLFGEVLAQQQRRRMTAP